MNKSSKKSLGIRGKSLISLHEMWRWLNGVAGTVVRMLRFLHVRHGRKLRHQSTRARPVHAPPDFF